MGALNEHIVTQTLHGCRPRGLTAPGQQKQMPSMGLQHQLGSFWVPVGSGKFYEAITNGLAQLQAGP
jgi:hypothetical protein